MQDDGTGRLGGNDMGDENGEDSSVMRIGKRCYVGNLAWKTSWQDLKDKFRDVGNVVYANVMRDDGGKSFPGLGRQAAEKSRACARCQAQRSLVSVPASFR